MKKYLMCILVLMMLLLSGCSQAADVQTECENNQKLINDICVDARQQNELSNMEETEQEVINFDMNPIHVEESILWCLEQEVNVVFSNEMEYPYYLYGDESSRSFFRLDRVTITTQEVDEYNVDIMIHLDGNLSLGPFYNRTWEFRLYGAAGSDEYTKLFSQRFQIDDINSSVNGFSNFEVLFDNVPERSYYLVVTRIIPCVE